MVHHLSVPVPASSEDALRWSHTAMVRRILRGPAWRVDVERRLQKAIGNVRRNAWGPIDLSANATKVIGTQLNRSYDAPPAIEAPDDAGQELVHLVSRTRHWARMPIIQRDAWACGEFLVRVDVDDADKPSFRPVPPDRVIAEPDPDHPDRPEVLQELRRRTIEGKRVWAWDVLDVTERSPTYRVLLDREGAPDPDGDVTAAVLGGPQSGDAYPYIGADGRPLIPYAIYRAVESGGFWHDDYTYELIDGTVNLAMYYTFFGHILKSSSWPQRYAINAEVAGATHEEDEDGGPGRSSLVADPATVVMLRSLADAAQQPQVGQWKPGGDPMVVIDAIGVYERRLASYAGITGADQMRMSGDPRSGYAVSVSRTTLREQMRRVEPVLSRTDEDLLRITAALLSRHTGRRYPEEGYRIHYQGVPESIEERDARRRHVLELLREGLIDRVTAYQELHPGTSRADAQVRVDEIARINRATAA